MASIPSPNPKLGKVCASVSTLMNASSAEDRDIENAIISLSSTETMPGAIASILAPNVGNEIIENANAIMAQRVIDK